MIPTHVIAPNKIPIRNKKYFTPNKKYKITQLGKFDFYTFNDLGEEVFCLIKNCNFLKSDSTDYSFFKKQWKLVTLSEDNMEEFELKTQFTLLEIAHLYFFSSNVNKLSNLYQDTKEILKQAGYSDANLSKIFYAADKHAEIKYVELSEALKEALDKYGRKKVKVGDKFYYEDELSTALSSIKPVE